MVPPTALYGVPPSDHDRCQPPTDAFMPFIHWSVLPAATAVGLPPSRLRPDAITPERLLKEVDDMAGSGYKDYFQVLGVNRNADADAIRRRTLARRHPDVNPGDKTAEATSEIMRLKCSLTRKRRRYEQFGQYWNQATVAGGTR